MDVASVRQRSRQANPLRTGAAPGRGTRNRGVSQFQVNSVEITGADTSAANTATIGYKVAVEPQTDVEVEVTMERAGSPTKTASRSHFSRFGGAVEDSVGFNFDLGENETQDWTATVTVTSPDVMQTSQPVTVHGPVPRTAVAADIRNVTTGVNACEFDAVATVENDDWVTITAEMSRSGSGTKTQGGQVFVGDNPSATERFSFSFNLPAGARDEDWTITVTADVGDDLDTVHRDVTILAPDGGGGGGGNGGGGNGGGGNGGGGSNGDDGTDGGGNGGGGNGGGNGNGGNGGSNGDDKNGNGGGGGGFDIPPVVLLVAAAAAAVVVL